jgi:hypothetical protein
MHGTPAPPNVCSDAVFALLHTFVENVELILSQLHSWHNILLASLPAFQENNIVRMQ